MFSWFKRQAPDPVMTTMTLTGTGSVSANIERLNDEAILHLSGEATIAGQDTKAHFTLSIKDTTSLRALCEMIHSVSPRMDKPPTDRYCDTSLLDDEPSNIYDDITATLGAEHAKEWIHELNVHLGLKTPHQTIRDGEAYRVRQILRQIKGGTFS